MKHTKLEARAYVWGGGLNSDPGSVTELRMVVIGDTPTSTEYCRTILHM